MGLGPMGTRGSPTPLHKPIRLRKSMYTKGRSRSMEDV
uniref:Uncharacterized protein n=1 Tax=Vitis vinifera TaxID=29760 RepID=F6GYJ1_VITVI